MIDETQMPITTKHAFKEKSAKLLTLLPLRTIYFRTFQCETPCIKTSNLWLRALLKCGYYSREGLIWGNTVSALKSWRNSSFLSGSSNSNPNFLCKIWVIKKRLSTLTSVEPKHKLLKAAKLCCSYWPRG